MLSLLWQGLTLRPLPEGAVLAVRPDSCVELDVVAVGAQEVLLDERNVVNDLLEHGSKLLHGPEVGLTAVEADKVLALEEGPAGLDRVEGAAVGRLELGTEVLVEELGALGGAVGRVVVHDKDGLALRVGVSEGTSQLDQEALELFNVGCLGHHELRRVEAVADGSKESDALEVLVVDRGDNHALARHPSALRLVPQLEGALVEEDQVQLLFFELLEAPSEDGPLLHQSGLVSLTDPGCLLGLPVGDFVAGVDQGERLGRDPNPVALLDEDRPLLHGEEAHVVEDLVRDELSLELSRQLALDWDALEDVVVVAVAVEVVALDDVFDGLVLDTSSSGDDRVGSNGLAKVSKRAVTTQEEVLDLGLS